MLAAVLLVRDADGKVTEAAAVTWVAEPSWAKRHVSTSSVFALPLLAVTALGAGRRRRHRGNPKRHQVEKIGVDAEEWLPAVVRAMHNGGTTSARPRTPELPRRNLL
jgi:MYXO-CTERM domain-containing protein